MASHVLDNCQIWLNDLDMTGMTNQAMLSPSGDVLDVSTFGSAGWREHIMGARQVGFEIGGPWGFEDPDDETWDHINASPADTMLTIATDAAEGDVAYIVTPKTLNRETGGSFGDVPMWKLTGKTGGSGFNSATNALSRGGVTIEKQTVTGVVTGTGVQLPIVGTGAGLMTGVVHVFADNGTSLDVIFERDDNPSFTTPTTVATAAVSGVGTEIVVGIAVLLGGDDYYRARTANLVGTNFQIAAAIGERL